MYFLHSMVYHVFCLYLTKCTIVNSSICKLQTVSDSTLIPFWKYPLFDNDAKFKICKTSWTDVHFVVGNGILSFVTENLKSNLLIHLIGWCRLVPFSVKCEGGSRHWDHDTEYYSIHQTCSVYSPRLSNTITLSVLWFQYGHFNGVMAHRST